MNNLKMAMLISAGLTVSATSSLLTMNVHAEPGKYDNDAVMETEKNKLSEEMDSAEKSELTPYHLTKYEMKTGRTHTGDANLDQDMDREMSQEMSQNTDREMSEDMEPKLSGTFDADISDTTVKFDVDSAELSSEAEDSLTGLLDAIRDSNIPEMDDDVEIVIIGHADKTGAEQKNQSLSMQRAEAVESFLKSEGIDNVIYETEAMGESDPIASNDTKSGRAENRRVEIIIDENEIEQELSSISQ